MSLSGQRTPIDATLGQHQAGTKRAAAAPPWPTHRLATVARLVTLVLFLSGGLRTAPVAAATSSIRFSPDYSQLFVDDVLEISLVIENVTDLYGLELRVRFDRTVLHLLDAKPDQQYLQVEPGDFPYPDLVARNEGSNETGTIWYALTQMAPREAAQGTGTAMTMRFLGRSPGTAVLDIQYAQLADSEGGEIAADLWPAEIIVVLDPTPIPLPPTPTEAPAATTAPTATVQEPTNTPRPVIHTPLPTAVSDGGSAQPTRLTEPTRDPESGYPPPQVIPLPTSLPPTSPPGVVPSTVPSLPLPPGATPDSPSTQPTGGTERGSTSTTPVSAPTAGALAVPGQTHQASEESPTPSSTGQESATPARVAALVPTSGTRATSSPAMEKTEPLIPTELFVCMLVVLVLFTLLLALYLLRAHEVRMP